MMTELELKSLAVQGYSRISLTAESLADLETPLSLYSKLALSARSEDGLIMGVGHRDLAGGMAPMEGAQLQPKSILSDHGHTMLRNVLRMGSRPLVYTKRA